MWGYTRFLLILPLIALLAGCGAHHSSIFRTYEVEKGGETKTSVIDAKQRAIVAMSTDDIDLDAWSRDRYALVCAEPSPDALSAISSTFSASLGGLFGSSQIEGALASGFQEAARQLGLRNATIQLLRDGLYRQCEAYMNGVIGPYFYEQIANKYVNAMVTLLAIEEITPSTAQSVEVTANEGSMVTADTNIRVDVPPSPDPEAGSEQDAPNPDAPEGGADSEQPVDPNDGGPNGGGSAQESTASAEAGPPMVGVNLPNNSVPVDPHISTAVSSMVTGFLQKDTVDFCLRTLSGDFGVDLADKSAGEFRRAFIQVCQSIILDQAEQQQTMAAASALVASGGTFGPDACSKALKAFWKPGGVFNTENQARIEAAMSNLEIGVSLAFLINAGELVEDRRRVGAALGLPACM